MLATLRTPLLVLAVATAPGLALADEVYLASGGQLSGRIVTRTATSIEVDVGAGRITVPTSSVVRIEEGRSPLHEYEERASRTAAGDVEGWLALGEWASSRGLGTQAREAYNRALAASPNDARAHQALGHVQLDGRWVSEDESYRARGYVLYEGDWITPAEHASILRERAAEDERQKAESRVRQAEARAEEAEARARQAEAAAAAEAAQTSEGLPLWYGWGMGPVLWPTQPVVRPPRQPVARPRPR